VVGFNSPEEEEEDVCFWNNEWCYIMKKVQINISDHMGKNGIHINAVTDFSKPQEYTILFI